MMLSSLTASHQPLFFNSKQLRLPLQAKFSLSLRQIPSFVEAALPWARLSSTILTGLARKPLAKVRLRAVSLPRVRFTSTYPPTSNIGGVGLSSWSPALTSLWAKQNRLPIRVPKASSYALMSIISQKMFLRSKIPYTSMSLMSASSSLYPMSLRQTT